MKLRSLGNTGIMIAPLVFGGNVFGWTVDERTSYMLLDAFVAQGFNVIDTADVYSKWAPGNRGGESESIIGNWLKARPGMRQKVVLSTKVGSDIGGPIRGGQSEQLIIKGVESSLRRLKVETIDLYFSHWPDTDTAYEETLGAFEKLLLAGKIRAVGASNYDTVQLGEALDVARQKCLPPFQVLQTQYNLYDRSFEGALRERCLREKLGVLAYSGLASGFLSGKYRTLMDLSQSQRSKEVKKYLNTRGIAILRALDEVAVCRGAKLAEVALSWLMSRAGIAAPIVSATSLDQLSCFVRAAELRLSAADVAALEEPDIYDDHIR